MSFFNCTQEKRMGMQLETQGKAAGEAGAATILPLPVRMNKHNKLTKIRGVAGVVKLGQS